MTQPSLSDLYAAANQDHTPTQPFGRLYVLGEIAFIAALFAFVILV
jgi:hypothetical protein